MTTDPLQVPDDDAIPGTVKNINHLVGAAFRAANDKRARSQQKALGMSSLGTCRRAAAFQVLDHPMTNPPNERTDIYADFIATEVPPGPGGSGRHGPSDSPDGGA